MSSVVLILNQDGISELIETANDLQTKMDNVMSSGKAKANKDRIADAGASTLLEAAREKLPAIMEEDDESGIEGGIKASTISTTASSKSRTF